MNFSVIHRFPLTLQATSYHDFIHVFMPNADISTSPSNLPSASSLHPPEQWHLIDTISLKRL